MKAQHGPSRAFSPTPETARDDRFVEAAKAFADAVSADGDTKPVVAARLGITPTKLARLTSHASGRHAPLGHAKGLGLASRVVLANWLLSGDGHAVVALPEAAERGECDYRFFATAVRQVTEAVSVSLEAASDGHFTRSEGAEVERLCDRAIGLLLTIREVARLAQREGVVGMRSLRGVR